MSVKKIDGSWLKTFGIVIALFKVEDKEGKFCFFKEIFLLADISINVAFGILFLTLGNVKINFNN